MVPTLIYASAVTIASAYLHGPGGRSSDKSLPELITTIAGTLVVLDLAPPVPPAPIGRIARDTNQYLVCRECGKKVRRLRWHLRAIHGLTALQYQRKWDLGVYYPMVASAYSERRSQIARENNLGHRS